MLVGILRIGFVAPALQGIHRQRGHGQLLQLRSSKTKDVTSKNVTPLWLVVIQWWFNGDLMVVNGDE